MAVVIWLCSHAHGMFRVVHDGTRRRVLLPDTEWLRRRLGQHDVGVKFACDYVQADDSCMIVGAALVEPGRMRCGPLTQWSEECKHLWEYLGKPLDAYSVNIVGVFRLRTPIPVCYRESNSAVPTMLPISNFNGLFRPFGFSADELGGKEGEVFDSRGGPLQAASSSLSEALHGWGADVADIQFFHAHMLPDPIARLVCEGSWTQVMFLARWRQRLWPEYPSEEWCRLTAGRPTPHIIVQQTPSRFADLALNLKKWAPLILADASSDEEASETRWYLESTVEWLEGCARMLNVSAKREDNTMMPSEGPQRPSGRVYNSICLIMAVLLRHMLTSTVWVPQVVRYSLECVFPNMFTEAFLKNIKAVMPSDETARRCDLYLDAALLLVHQEDNAIESRTRFGWADSSLQCGRDWLLGKTNSVGEEECELVVSAARRLARSAERLDDEMCPEDTAAANAALETMPTERVHTPVAMGLRMTTLAHKVAALAWSFWLETGTLCGLLKFLASYVSFTTDLGTEVGISKFTFDDVWQLLPWWFRESAVETDEWEGAGERLSSFMPQALVIGGALHILHTVQATVTIRMELWQKFFKQCQNIAALLCNRGHRERFVATCLLGSPLANAVRHFEYFSAKPYEARWGEVVQFLFEIEKQFDILANSWDEQKYEKGSSASARSQEAPEGMAFSPKELTSTLQDKWFACYRDMALALFDILRDLQQWFESCSCHPPLKGAERAPTQGRRARRRTSSSRPCPMNGKRAPELACNCLHTVLNTLSNVAWSPFAATWAGRLDEGTWASITHDFEAARSYIQLTLQLKFDFWIRLPWKLCGLAHYDYDLARKCAAECLNEYAEQRDVGEKGNAGNAAWQHPLVEKFLKDGSSLRLSGSVWKNSRKVQICPRT